MITTSYSEIKSWIQMSGRPVALPESLIILNLSWANQFRWTWLLSIGPHYGLRVDNCPGWKTPSQDSLFNPPEGSVSREEKSFLSHRVLVSKGHFCSGGDIPSEKK